MSNKTIADRIYETVLNALQEAEELGGPELQEYIDLMEKISAEAAERAYNAKFQRGFLENNPITKMNNDSPLTN